MSGEHRTRPRKQVHRSLSALLSRYYGVTPPQVRAVPFWLTVCLPWAILLLTVTGIASNRPDLLAGLVGATLLCAVLGRGYPQ
jgi:hypothetical protein